jgi:DNA polymerase (family X)
MDKFAVALVLEEIAVLMELHGEHRFKAGAFRQAARVVERMDAEVSAALRSGELAALPGFGPATTAVVRDLVERGGSRLHADLRARTPAGMIELLGVSGLGPRKISVLREELGVESVADLRHAIESGAILKVPGFGERMSERLAASLTFVSAVTGRRRRPQALQTAARLAAHIGLLSGVSRVESAGELRRGWETVGAVDLVVAAEAALLGDVAAEIAHSPGLEVLAQQADHVEARLADGLAVRIRLVTPDRFGAAWVETTGSAAHVASLEARIGQPLAAIAAAEESDVYDLADATWLPPECREHDVDEMADPGVPRLVEFADLRGTFHCHTTWSDGAASLMDMAEGAAMLGWRYLGIADHSQAAHYAGGLRVDDVKRQREEIEEWNARHGDRLWLFHGIEADILADGSLDYAAEGAVLDGFDYVVGSVHSHFKMEGEAMTRRVVRALSDPRMTMLAHPTGRLLLTRDGYDIDLDEVIRAAAENGVIIEINSDPHRMELDWREWPRARAAGVRTSINPDAHSVAALDNVRYGVTVARKGGLTAGDVLNTGSLEDVRHYFAERRGRS